MPHVSTCTDQPGVPGELKDTTIEDNCVLVLDSPWPTRRPGFAFELPFSADLPPDEEAPRRREDAEPKACEQTQTILVIDDEPVVLNVLAKMLARLGYKALVAESGPKALEIFRRAPEAVDLVVLDIVMPEMNGLETFARLLQIKPDVRVLLCSGYQFDHSAQSMLDRGARGFVQKPFQIDSLKAFIRRALDR